MTSLYIPVLILPAAILLLAFCYNVSPIRLLFCRRIGETHGRDIQVPLRLIDPGVRESAFPGMAEGTLKVVCPMENNPRPVSFEDAIQTKCRVF